MNGQVQRSVGWDLQFLGVLEMIVDFNLLEELGKEAVLDLKRNFRTCYSAILLAMERLSRAHLFGSANLIPSTVILLIDDTDRV